MNEIVLSICIPTYNRSRYLSVLLKMLVEVIGGFKYSVEIIISDNASTDNTSDVVGEYLDKLPINYYRQDSNIGVENSLIFAINKSRGIYFTYLADDDLLEVGGLNSAIDLLVKNPESIALYAPWMLFDLVGNINHGQFYNQSGDVVVKKNDFSTMVNHVFLNQVWPEIGIMRTDYFKRINPKFSDLSYWAFTIPCEYLTFGSVIFASTPFYISIGRYFEDENRTQAGNLETETAWDRYRGGWEYMLSRIISTISYEENLLLRSKIDQMVIGRMLVAFNFRWVNERNALENYYLACRIRGLGAEKKLPVSFGEIRTKAALYYAAHDSFLTNGVNSICCVGDFPDLILKNIREMSSIDFLHFSEFNINIKNSLIIFSGDFSDYQFNFDEIKSSGNKIIFEADLIRKFY